jgi:hypothetical protein
MCLMSLTNRCMMNRHPAGTRTRCLFIREYLVTRDGMESTLGWFVPYFFSDDLIHHFWRIFLTLTLDLLLAPFSGANHSTRTGGGALWSGADGPRPWAGRFATWAQERCLPCVTPDGPQLWTGRSATWRQGRLPPPCWNLDLVPWGKRS